MANGSLARRRAEHFQSRVCSEAGIAEWPELIAGGSLADAGYGAIQKHRFQLWRKLVILLGLSSLVVFKGNDCDVFGLPLMTRPASKGATGGRLGQALAPRGSGKKAAQQTKRNRLRASAGAGC